MSLQDNCLRPPRLDIVRVMLESALDTGAQEYVAACRRLLWADLIGWRRHAEREGWKIVLEAYKDMRADESPVDAESARDEGKNRRRRIEGFAFF
jgi:hypothetical protein